MNLDNFKIQIRKMTDFSEEECAMFIPHLRTKTYEKGGFLLKEGKNVQELSLIHI